MQTPIRLGRWATLLVAGMLLAEAPDGRPEVGLDNVVILLDASGSMSAKMAATTKMAAAKAALREVLQQLPPNIQVGLLVFSGSGIANEWVYPLGPRDDAGLLAAINRPQPHGGTPLGAYIKRAADRLLLERQDRFGYGTYRLLIVTDGEAQDQHLVDRYTPEVMARGITVDVIGVAMSQRHTLATKVHSYRSANDPQSLQRAIAEVLAEVGAGGTDTAQSEAFAELAPLPEGLARAALQALSTSGNQPIGESVSGPPPAAPAPQAAPSAPRPSPPAAPSASARSGPGLVWGLLGALACSGAVGILLLAILVRSISRKRRR